jgi:hypothetical protein
MALFTSVKQLGAGVPETLWVAGRLVVDSLVVLE